jgi:glycosyltransferase involved in cell wall biosynthesis
VRIAWVLYGHLDQLTGGTIYDRQIVDGLRARGDAVQVVSLARGSDPAALAQRLAAAQCEAVVCDALASKELGPALLSLAGTMTRTLLVHHLTSWEGGAPADGLQVEDERRAILASDQLIATSHWTAARLLAEHRVPADVVVPGADRLPHLRDARSDDGSVRLLYVGSIIPRKRLPLLLEAMDRLAEPHLQLRIVGDPARDRAHAEMVSARIWQSLHLRASVYARGVVNDTELAHELALSDCLVLPSSIEGYGMVLTEALHAGRPVIAARTGAIPEALGPGGGDCALFFDTAEDLLDLLRRFATEPALRARMRSAAAACAAWLPTWNAAAERFRDVLTRAVARRAASAPSAAHGR